MQGLGGTSEPNGIYGGGTTYSDAQVLSLLTAADIVEDWSVDLLDSNLGHKADLSWAVDRGGADIAHDSTAAVKRTVAIPKVSGASLIDARLPGSSGIAAPLLVTDVLRIWYKLGTPDGGWLRVPMGTFMQPAPAVTSSTEAGTWLAIQGADLCQFLLEATFATSYATGVGETYQAAIRSILMLAGGIFVRGYAFWIPDSGQIIQAPLGWDAGVSLLTAINQLLAAIGYTSAYTDAMGMIRAVPLPDFAAYSASFTFDCTQGQAIVTGPITRSPDPSKIFNACKVVGEDARKSAVNALYLNNSPTSPISILNLGRTKLLLIKDSQVADYASAFARAKYEVQIAAANFAPISLRTFAWPFSENMDVYRLVYRTPDEGVVSYLVQEQKWAHHLGAGGQSTHTLNVVTAV